MQTQNNSNTARQKIVPYLINATAFIGITALTLGLISCGGGGDTSAPSSTAITISSVTSNGRHGMVASSVQQTITLKGSNFAAGMTVSILSPDGAIVNLPDLIPSAINTTVTPNVMNVPVTIPNAPTARYVTLGIKSGNSIVATYDAFGVASTDQYLLSGTTTIQSILSTKCAGCHTGAAPHYLNLSDGTLTNSTGTIDINSTYCSSKKRVVAGDPRRTSSILLDRIMAAPASLSCNNSPMPPSTSTQLTAPELAALIDWVAGGAK